MPRMMMMMMMMMMMIAYGVGYIDSCRNDIISDTYIK